MSTEKVRELGQALRGQFGRVIIGQEEAIQLLMVALVAEGHVLFEGPPGTGKTLLARSFAACLKLELKRVQFTPDLMPGDLVGTNLFNFQTNTFAVTKGPVFTEILLADEINRTPPKTQAALLEAMQERTVTIDGTSHPLAARSAAVLEGREFVIPDDIKTLFKPLLRHRVVLAPSAEVDGLGADQVLDQVLAQVPAPR